MAEKYNNLHIIISATEPRNSDPDLESYWRDRFYECYVRNDVECTLRLAIQHQEEEIENLKAALEKARGGCKRLRESNDELLKRVQTIKECFDQEREARINRDKQYTKLFEEHENFKKNCQRSVSYRPCYVEGRQALFHGWFTEPFRSFRNPEPTNVAYGLVEFENGNLRKVNPYEIRFMDDEVRRVWEGKV